MTEELALLILLTVATSSAFCALDFALLGRDCVIAGIYPIKKNETETLSTCLDCMLLYN